MISFPTTWQFGEAKDLCSELVDCINKTAPTVEFETPYKMIRTTNVKKGRVDLTEAKCVDEATFIKWNRRLKPEYRDIILTREAPLGDVGLIRTDEQVFLGQRTMLFRANPEILDQNFLYYTLLGPTAQAQIRTFGSGSTVEHVRVPDAEKITIPYPDLATQRKIAAILTAYDDLIEVNKRRIALLEKMAEELYREWFVRLRFPGFQDTRFLKGVPEGWTTKRLPELSQITYGFPFQSQRFNSDGIGKPIVRIRNIPNSSTSDYTDEPAADKYLVNTGDLLVGMDGEFHINHWYGSQAYLVQRACRIRADLPEFRGYLALAIRSPIKHLEGILASSGATVGHLGAKHLNAIEILVPPENMREHLGYLNTLFDQKLALHLANRNLVKTRDLLLPRLISGKLSVEDLDIQFPPSMRDDTEEQESPPEARHA